jgi:hypothetical protein
MEKEADPGEIQERSRRDPGEIQERSRPMPLRKPYGFPRAYLLLLFCFFSASFLYINSLATENPIGFASTFIASSLRAKLSPTTSVMLAYA